MVREYIYYILMMDENSHMRENYTDYIFMIHEYIYRVVPFAVYIIGREVTDKSVQKPLIGQIYPNKHILHD